MYSWAENVTSLLGFVYSAVPLKRLVFPCFFYLPRVHQSTASSQGGLLPPRTPRNCCQNPLLSSTGTEAITKSLAVLLCGMNCRGNCLKCSLFIPPSYKDCICSESAYSCLLFLELLGLTNGEVVMQMYIEKNILSICKKPSLNLPRSTSVLKKWVRRSTRHLLVCATPGTAEGIVPNTHFRGSDTYIVSILI